MKAGDSFGRNRIGQGRQRFVQPGRWRNYRSQYALANKLETLNADPYGAGWMVKIKLTDESALRNLMDYAAYQKMCAEEQH